MARMLAMAVLKAKGGDRTRIRSALEKLGQFEGASCPLNPPFTSKRHEANNINCFVLAKFKPNGEIVPDGRDRRP
ncbi:hypothetical protein EBR21_07830 [bacterium]|nr:hypothetical protein [bacterium]